MRLVSVGLAVAALSAMLRAQPEPVRAFVEVEPANATAWLHEPVIFVVRVGCDSSYFASSVVPLFQQPLDRPFQVVLPWMLAAEDRAVEVLPPAEPAKALRVAVDDFVLPWSPAGRRDVGGRLFEVLELRCRWLPLAAGSSPIAPVQLRYAFATRFEEDFLRGRQPVDRQEATVQSAAGVLEVKPLPAAGRPAGFTGAVGDFTVRASASVSSVPVGGTFALEVTVAGAGNLERFAPMPLPKLPGFHVQGVVERRSRAERTFVFDVLALREGLEAVPSVELAAFSPRAGAYVVHATEPVPLRVLPQATGTELPPRVEELRRADAEAVRAARAVPWWGWFLAGVFAVALWSCWRAGHTSRARAAARRAAADRLVAAWPKGPEAALAALDDLLAISNGAGAAAEEKARSLRAALDAARYGGVMPPATEMQAVLGALN